MGFNANPGSLRRIRVPTRAMEDAFKKPPPAPLFGHYAHVSPGAATGFCGTANVFLGAENVCAAIGFCGAVNGFLGAVKVVPSAENVCAVNVSPVEPLHSFSLCSLSIEDKDWPLSSQVARSALVAHSDLPLFQVAMADRDVTLNDLQTSLKDIKQHIRWLYDIMNRGGYIREFNH